MITIGFLTKPWRLALLFLALLALVRADEAVVSTSFETLGGFALPGEAGCEQLKFPSSVVALNGKVVQLTGFMLPLKIEDGKVSEFLLLKDQNACCYGRMPRLSEWIVVRPGEKGVQPQMDVPIHCRGLLSVGERREGDLVLGVYFMSEGELVNKP
jgi:hypothetical protein